jgi:glycosyltransferase involved in cell wall biosynthesis
MSSSRANHHGLRWAGERPLVSVIIIFLNAERFIVEAIESVLQQECRDLELLLVDDGSREACAAIARDYAARCAPFVRYLQHPRGENRGMSASRNLGLSAAQAELVAFIDADDVWSPSKLREQLAIMQAHPELGMVAGAVRYWSSWEGGQDCVVPTGHVQDRVIVPPEAAIKLYPLGFAAAACPSDLLLRREIVASIGGFEEHFTGENQMYEDQGFFSKLYLVAPVYFSSRVWLSYRQHADSCVSVVTQSGRYDTVRRYYLDWFRGYLARQPRRLVEVEAALRRARRPYDYPRTHRTLSVLGRTQTLGRQLARLAVQIVRGE